MWTVEQVQSPDLVLEPEPEEQQWPISLYGNVKCLIACDGLYGQSLQTPITWQPEVWLYFPDLNPLSCASYRQEYCLISLFPPNIACLCFSLLDCTQKNQTEEYFPKICIYSCWKSPSLHLQSCLRNLADRGLSWESGLTVLLPPAMKNIISWLRLLVFAAPPACLRSGLSQNQGSAWTQVEIMKPASLARFWLNWVLRPKAFVLSPAVR